MELQFKTRNLKQIEAIKAWLDDMVELILYGGGKGGGKSFLMASLIFGDALIYPGTHYFIARKHGADLRKFTTPTIYEVFDKFGLKHEEYMRFNGQDNVFELHNGSKVFLIACKDEPADPYFERFGSMQMTRGALEEAGEIEESAKANLWLSIGRWKNAEFGLKKKMIITANPKKGWMKREFVDPFYSGILSAAKRFIKALALDNPYLTDDYVRSLSEEKDAVRRQRLYEGDWDYDESKDSIVVESRLSDMFSITLVKKPGRFMSVDVGRKGDDPTVINVFEGLESIFIGKYAKQATNITEQKIKDIAAIYHVPFSNIIIDEDGIGGGVVDHLFGVRGFTANSTPIPTANEIRLKLSKVDGALTPKIVYNNLKTQCGFKLAEMINERQIAVKTDSEELRTEIIEDLSAMLHEREPDTDGKRQLRKKAVVREELGRSPDVGDTFLMRIWFELAEAVPTAVTQTPEHVVNLQQNKFARTRESQAANSSR